MAGDGGSDAVCVLARRMFADFRAFTQLGYQYAPHYGNGAPFTGWDGDAPTVDHVDSSMLMPPGGGENGPAPTVSHVASSA